MRPGTKLGLVVLIGIAPLACEAQSIATLNSLQKATTLTPDLLSGEHLYIQYCSACHQGNGWGSGPRDVPALAGQQDIYILKQLIKFSMLDRVKKEMHAVVSKPEVASAQALRDISAYVASLPRNPASEPGDGTQLPAGERVYAQSCAICHGQNGAGSRQDLIPAIGGQHNGYLLMRLHHFAQNHGSQESGSLEPAAINVLSGLSPGELNAVADYTSRLPALRAP